MGRVNIYNFISSSVANVPVLWFFFFSFETPLLFPLFCGLDPIILICLISSQVGLCSSILPDHPISCHSFTLDPSRIPQYIDLHKILYVIPSLKFIFKWLSNSPKDRLCFLNRVTCLITLFAYIARSFTLY